jgi:hypothetical protein
MSPLRQQATLFVIPYGDISARSMLAIVVRHQIEISAPDYRPV